MSTEFNNLVVIGASAGGIKAVAKSIQGIPASVNAAFVVVIHVSAHSSSENIVALLQRKTFLKCKVAQAHDTIERGHLYLASPDMQLMVDDGKLFLQAGASENKFRPSVDVLFRSAAVHFKNHTIGIILTGLLNDGTSGMWAIKQCGGICIVQEPSDAEFADMPKNVLAKIEADYICKLDEIANLTTKLVNGPLPKAVFVPRALEVEVEITKNRDTRIDAMNNLASHSDFSCPECGGRLWTISEGENTRYRCHTGHVYTENLLAELQDLNIKESVIIAIRMMEENSNLLVQMKNKSQLSSERKSYYEKRVQNINHHIDLMKKLMILLHESPSEDEFR